MTEGEVMAAAFSDHRFDPSAVEIVSRAAPPPTSEPTPPAIPRPRVVTPVPEPRSEPRSSPEVSEAEAAMQRIKERAWTGDGWRDAPPPPPEEQGELSAEERRILEAAKRAEWLPTLRIRGLSRARALVDLADFVSLHQAGGRSYVRVITGKGVGSRREPVLKHALVAWCADEGHHLVRGIAPDREVSLEFGAFVLALRRNGRRSG